MLQIGQIVLHLRGWHIAKQSSNLFDEEFCLLQSQSGLDARLLYEAPSV